MNGVLSLRLVSFLSNKWRYQGQLLRHPNSVFDSLPQKPVMTMSGQVLSSSSKLWPRYLIGQAIIFLPCDFYLSFLLLLFSSPNLSGRRLDVYHTSTHSVALVRIQNACVKCAARGSLKIQHAKNRHFDTITQLCWAVSSQLRHVSTIGKNC